MAAVSGKVSTLKLIRGAAMFAVLVPLGLAACSSPPPPPPPAPVYTPAPPPPPPPAPMVPAARG